MSPHWLYVFLLFSSLSPPVSTRRAGGGGVSMGRGRGSSGARSGGGLFGGGSASIGKGRNSAIGGQTYGKLPGHGTRQHGAVTNWGTGAAGVGGAAAGYGLGQTQRGHSVGGAQFGSAGMNPGGWNSQPKYTKSGVGSFVRSNSFKNAIVGAAAGYLTYQAGKAIIRAAAGPMYWNDRPYYWGAQHFQPRHGMTNMCRMPIQSNDPQFGNVEFQDQSRPREIVWGCGYYEHCCGYECCRGGGASGYGRGIGLGWAATIILVRFLM